MASVLGNFSICDKAACCLTVNNKKLMTNINPVVTHMHVLFIIIKYLPKQFHSSHSMDSLTSPTAANFSFSYGFIVVIVLCVFRLVKFAFIGHV